MSPAARIARPLLALLTPLLLVSLAACGDDEDPNTLPDGATLVSESATVMQGVETAHIVLDIEGAVGALPIKRAEGDLKRDGDAKGTIQLQQGANLIEAEFIIVGNRAFLKYPTGGWQPAGAITMIYDPAAILDPDKGVAELLATASNARTEGTETVGGVDTYRVAVDVDQDAADTLVPGVPDGLTGLVWIDQQTKHLVKAVVNAPASGGNDAATITVTLTNFDEPVTVSEP